MARISLVIGANPFLNVTRRMMSATQDIKCGGATMPQNYIVFSKDECGLTRFPSYQIFRSSMSIQTTTAIFGFRPKAREYSHYRTSNSDTSLLEKACQAMT